MAGSKSDYLEQKLLDHTFNKAAFSAPANLYVALFTVAPTDAGGGTEVSGNAYARVSTAAANWTRTGSSMANNGSVTFPKANGGNWGTVVAFGIFDAATVGNLLYWGDLTVNKDINDQDTAVFEASSLTVTED